jgi:hypothetical protein
MAEPFYLLNRQCLELSVGSFFAHTHTQSKQNQDLNMKHPKINVFSVHKDAMASSARAFERDWPEAQIDNLPDDGLPR